MYKMELERFLAKRVGISKKYSMIHIIMLPQVYNEDMEKEITFKMSNETS